MAEKYLTIFGQRYEADEPAFLTTEQGVRVWDRIKDRWLTWASLDAKATAEGHVWQPREIGIPSMEWQIHNSVSNGQHWAPGLDDTSGLATELVTNGETWVGAAGDSTPPTGWTDVGTSTFTDFSGTLNVYGDAILGGGMTQTVTGTPGVWYVLEVLNEIDTTAGVRLTLNDTSMPIGPGPADDDGDGGASEVISVSFQMPASGESTVGIVCAGGAIASIGHIRCFTERELTGSG